MGLSASEHFHGARVLITGGLGFVGSNLAHHLVAAGADVLVVDWLKAGYGGNLFNVAPIRDRLRIEIADVCDAPTMAHLVEGQDFVFNLAAQVSHVGSMDDPHADLEANVRGPLVLLEACRQRNRGATVVFTGTRQVYGRPQYVPVDERHPTCPIDVNGVNKLAGELYHRVYHQACGLQTVALRLTNTYGPRMHVRDARQTFLGWWVRQLLKGQALQIFGDGMQVRDFNFVDDVVEALLLAASTRAAIGQSFNLGGEPISLGALARELIKLNGSGHSELVPFPRSRERIEIGDFHADTGAIRGQLGWQPRTNLREGLERTLRFYRAHLDEYV